MNTIKVSLFLIASIVFAGCGGGSAPVEEPKPQPPARWAGAQVVPCATITNPIVLILAGQSQVTNGIPDKNNAYSTVYAFWDGQCVAAVDPLPGSENPNGTIASRLGDRITARSGWRNVLILNFGVGGTEISEWLPGTANNAMLLKQIDALNEAGLPPAAVLWLQGESDCRNGTTGAEYKERFAQLLSSLREHTDAPVRPAVETWVEGHTCPELADVQRALPDAAAGVYAGPDLDSLGAEYRRQDGTHFTTPGAERAADLLRDSL